MRMNYHIAARMDRMAPSGIRKVNEKALAMERAGERVLHFEIGRPDFDTPEYIKKAADQALAQGKVHYTSNFGMMELRQAIADKLKRENHIDYKASEVLVTVGLSEAVFAVLATLLDEGDEILVPDPVWLNYINVPNLLGARAVTYSLKEENGYQMDFGEQDHPQDPGRGHRHPQQPHRRRAGGGCAQGAGLHCPGARPDGDCRRDLRAAGVRWGQAREHRLPPRYEGAHLHHERHVQGLRHGRLAAGLCGRSGGVHHRDPSFVQAAAIAALTQEGDEVKEMVKEYQRRRDYAVKAINDIDGIRCLCPKGAFYIFINCRELGKSSAELSQYFLEEAKIALVPGDVFGPGGEGYLRMSFAASYESIVEGCQRLKEAVSALRK